MPHSSTAFARSVFLKKLFGSELRQKCTFYQTFAISKLSFDNLQELCVPVSRKNLSHEDIVGLISRGFIITEGYDFGIVLWIWTPELFKLPRKIVQSRHCIRYRPNTIGNATWTEKSVLNYIKEYSLTRAAANFERILVAKYCKLEYWWIVPDLSSGNRVALCPNMVQLDLNESK